MINTFHGSLPGRNIVQDRKFLSERCSSWASRRQKKIVFGGINLLGNWVYQNASRQARCPNRAQTRVQLDEAQDRQHALCAVKQQKGQRSEYGLCNSTEGTHSCCSRQPYSSICMQTGRATKFFHDTRKTAAKTTTILQYVQAWFRAVQTVRGYSIAAVVVTTVRTGALMLV